jgi:subtilisin-like proprotein convertase family protein
MADEQMNGRGRLAVLAGLAAGLAGGPAWAADVVAVPIGDRIEVFEITDMHAPRGEARRLDAPASRVVDGRLLPVPDAVARPLAGRWTLSDRVVIRATDIAGVARDAGLDAGAFAPVAGRPGWYTIETGTVRGAAALARSLRSSRSVVSAEVDLTPPFDLRSAPNDPLFSQQWHLQNDLTPGVDVGAVDAWSMGYTGLGVMIGIIESGGFKTDHEDLAPRFDPFISQSNQFTSSHMTNVAGIAAGAGDNGLGVAGVAYNAGLAQRLIGSNFATASALTAFNDVIHVKNNSWGPSDDGRFDFPSPLVINAIADAAMTGRNGLGEIIVWAGGNGASADDRVDYDPYASSRYVIGVGAVGDNNRRADYSEPGASLLISTYSNGGARGITTTQSNGGYTANFGGTSAASPLAAGVVALMLEANPALTWRDVQHILVATARPVDPGDEGWTVNGAELLVNDNYGFGLVDAFGAVSVAEGWTGVGEEIAGSSGAVQVNQPIPDDNPVGLSIPVPVDDAVRCESVELVLDVSTTSVGDLRISMVSPEGTTSVFARPRIDPQDNYTGTVFTSVRHWGERADGVWTVRISDERGGETAVWNSAEIRVYGTDAGPGPCQQADLAEPYGILDLADTLAFVIAFQTGGSDADFAAPFGTLNGDDISGFIEAFLNGCGE